jgi:hypothetical protein
MNDIKKCYHKDDKEGNSESENKVVPLKKKFRRIVDKIFESPERPDVKWKDVESLMGNLGGVIKEGSGSRKRFTLNDTRATFHEPHPGKELDKGAVKSLRKYLVNSEVFDKDGKKLI